MYIFDMEIIYPAPFKNHYNTDRIIRNSVVAYILPESRYISQVIFCPFYM